MGEGERHRLALLATVIPSSFGRYATRPPPPPLVKTSSREHSSNEHAGQSDGLDDSDREEDSRWSRSESGWVDVDPFPYDRGEKNVVAVVPR